MTLGILSVVYLWPTQLWYHIHMDRKSKILSIVLVLMIVWSVWATYDRIVIKHDYLVSIEVPCDPITESCFVLEEEGEDTYFYKIVEKSAYNLPECDPTDESCLESIVCVFDEVGCTLIYCDVSLNENCSNYSVSKSENGDGIDSSLNMIIKDS